MSNYAILKSAIQQVIKTNGNNEITGTLLQQSLLSMINSLGVGYQFVGIATPSTNPGTPDQNVFYVASESGTYSNFGGLAVSDGEVAIFKYNGTWTKEVTGAATAAQVTQLGQEVNEIKTAYKGWKEITPYTTEEGGYLAFGKFYRGGNYVTTFYPVQQGDEIIIAAKIIIDAPTLDYATLFPSIPEPGDSGTVVITPITENAVISQTIQPATNGYLAVVTKRGTHDAAEYLTVKKKDYIDFQTQIDDLEEDVEDIKEDVEDIKEDVETLNTEVDSINDTISAEFTKDVYKDIGNNNEVYLLNCWMSSQFNSINSFTGPSIRGYKVNVGDKLKITGILTSSDAYVFVGFKAGETAPVAGDTITDLVDYGNTDKNLVSFDYTVTAKGYILLGFRNSTVENKYSGYDWGIYIAQYRKDAEELVFPGKINVVVGDKLQLFYRGMAKVIDTKGFDFYAKCRYGSLFPRYFEFQPIAGNVGRQVLYLQMRNIDGQILSSQQLNLNVVAAPISPANEKKILILGDSLTQGGTWPHELDRRLTSNDAATPTMPAGNNLSNIKFIGGMEYSGTRYFGVGGWGWPSYSGPGSPAYRFQVTGVSTIVKDEVYSNNGHQFKILENNTTNGAGNILCSVSSIDDAPEESGILTKVSGSGDLSIVFTSASADQQNPLWDGEKISFSNYVSELGESGLDCVYLHLGWNNITSEMSDFSALRGEIELILDALHTDYPLAKAVLVGLQLPSLNGGLGANYGARGGYSNLFGIIRAVFNYNAFLRSISEDDNYSGFVSYVDIASQFDSENNMPQSATQVNTRNSETEMRGTNGVHPAIPGYLQIADAAYRWFVANFCQS